MSDAHGCAGLQQPHSSPFAVSALREAWAPQCARTGAAEIGSRVRLAAMRAVKVKRRTCTGLTLLSLEHRRKTRPGQLTAKWA
jgi:hypothetical protein